MWDNKGLWENAKDASTKAKRVLLIPISTTAGGILRPQEMGWEWKRKGVSGGAGGTRTPYLFNAIEALSQMSYSPMQTGRREEACGIRI